ncbi:hypothetical protein L208DRAFT_1412159 [Tricholoma matsutake]|nr:hypothetical protein L208DRAFT_1412159 [Tricholoma matsutake 945]
MTAIYVNSGGIFRVCHRPGSSQSQTIWPLFWKTLSGLPTLLLFEPVNKHFSS